MNSEKVIEDTLYLDDDNDDDEEEEGDSSYEYSEEELDAILVDVVKNYSFLYDKTHSDFKDIYKKERTWAEISNMLHLSVYDCKHKWQRLRERFSLEKKMRDLEKRRGSKLSATLRFTLYDSMLYLESFVASQKTKSNASKEKEIFTPNTLKRPAQQVTSLCEQKTSRLGPLSSSFAPISPTPSLSVSMSPALSASASPSLLSVRDPIPLHPQRKEVSAFSTPPPSEITKSPNDCETLSSKVTKRRKIQQNDVSQQILKEIEQSSISLTNIANAHYSQRKIMDEDDIFCCNLAFELRKMTDSRKIEIKRKIMKTIYDF